MNFTESLTEPLRAELFPKLPKQLLALLNLLCHSAATVTAMKRFEPRANKPPQAVMKKNKSHLK